MGSSEGSHLVTQGANDSDSTSQAIHSEESWNNSGSRGQLGTT